MTHDSPTTDAGHTDNSTIVNAPLDFVWQMTNDLRQWPDLFTEYAAVEILSEVGSTFRFRLSMHPDQNGVVWSWVSERTLDHDAHHVVAQRVEPGPFEFMNIDWSYAEVPGGVAMRWIQDFRMKPTAPIDTAAMTARIDANSKVQMAIIAAKVEAAAAEQARTMEPVS